MIQTFTPNDLLRHLYTEDNPIESYQIEHELAHNETMTDDFNHLSCIKSALNKILMDPSDDSVQYILEYSRITA